MSAQRALPFAALLFAFALSAPRAQIVPADYPGPLQLAGQAQPAKTRSDVYIVQLAEPGAASYKGLTPGFSATKPGSGQRFDASAPAVETYVRHLERSHDAVLATGGGGRKLYSFRYAFNGFAAALTPAEVTRIARHPDVVGVWRDTDHRVRTNNSSLFLGLLDQNGGLRADLGLTGENVIVAVIDSGVDPMHPALQDFEESVPRACRSEWAEGSWLGFFLCGSILRDPPTAPTYDPPIGFTGICQAGDAFPATACNNKLVGARYYNDGFLRRHELNEAEILSAKDVDGHGTHIATTIAGNLVDARLFGSSVGEISGVAPRARVAVYKACWLTPGETRATCTSSDLARAIDDAVGDGVDIINYSIGSLEPDLTAPEGMALLNALDAGVLSVVAAGNNGPDNFTLGSPGSAPWVLTVGATTQSGTRFEEAIEVVAPDELAGLAPMREASFTTTLRQAGPIEAPVVLVDDGQEQLGDGETGSVNDGCEPLVNADEVDGAIALVERGGCTFLAKLSRVAAAGAVGAIVYARTGDPVVMNSDGGERVDLPAVMIGAADGDVLADAYRRDERPVARLEHGVLASIRTDGDQLADFSSRGPALSESDFIKPDVAAPGVDILAGSSPDILGASDDQYFQYRSGTSMAAPMVSGVAALLREAQPEWSVATLKSALMTTANGQVVTEDGEFLANPFDVGSGRIDGNAALRPGLVYETDYDDFRAYLCGTDARIVPEAECAALTASGRATAPGELNLPSIGITELIPGDRITRRVTNIGPAAVYSSTIEPPPGMSVRVVPPTLSLASGETAEFSLEFDVETAPYDFWQFGNIGWSDGVHSVDAPLAAQPVLMRAPRDLELPGLSGTGQLAVDSGYSGGYVAAVHGLRGPSLREPGVVADDPNDDFTFRFDNGVTAHFFTLGPGDLYLRVALFDALTDGQDDLDLYLYRCPTLANCAEIGKSGSLTSDETIDVVQPEPGLYAVLVHGFETDQAAGGPGASYELLAWSFGPGGDEGNLSIEAPDEVERGARLAIDYEWGPLDSDTLWLGGISHSTPFAPFYLTIVTANWP